MMIETDILKALRNRSHCRLCGFSALRIAIKLAR